LGTWQWLSVPVEGVWSEKPFLFNPPSPSAEKRERKVGLTLQVSIWWLSLGYLDEGHMLVVVACWTLLVRGVLLDHHHHATLPGPLPYCLAAGRPLGEIDDA
jgi:hypothetical protein